METPIDCGRDDYRNNLLANKSYSKFTRIFPEFISSVINWNGWPVLGRYTLISVIAFTIGERNGKVIKYDEPLMKAAPYLTFDEKKMTAEFHKNYLELKRIKKENEYARNN